MGVGRARKQRRYSAQVLAERRCMVAKSAAAIPLGGC
jgi:hypothetical protein